MQLRSGPATEVFIADSIEAERRKVGGWTMRRLDSGMFVNELAVFVRGESLIRRALDAILFDGARVHILGQATGPTDGCIVLGTMHQATGLEFRAVVVMGCDADVLPLRARLEGVADAADVEDVYASERQLLYGACRCAREHLLVTGVKPGSEFLGETPDR